MIRKFGSSLIIVIHVLLTLHLAQQIVALLVHLRVFTAAVGGRAVVVVHLVVIDVIRVVEGGRVGVSKKKFSVNALEGFRMVVELLPGGDFREHALRHDDRIFQLFEH